MRVPTLYVHIGITLSRAYKRLCADSNTYRSLPSTIVAVLYACTPLLVRSCSCYVFTDERLLCTYCLEVYVTVPDQLCKPVDFESLLHRA